MLSDELGKLEPESKLAQSLRAIRAAMRRFLDAIAEDEARAYPPRADFFRAIGELRGLAGIHVAQIAVQFGLDVESELAAVLPEKAGDD
jgi:hypothetical protein